MKTIKLIITRCGDCHHILSTGFYGDWICDRLHERVDTDKIAMLCPLDDYEEEVIDVPEN